MTSSLSGRLRSTLRNRIRQRAKIARLTKDKLDLRTLTPILREATGTTLTHTDRHAVIRDFILAGMDARIKLASQEYAAALADEITADEQDEYTRHEYFRQQEDSTILGRLRSARRAGRNA